MFLFIYFDQFSYQITKKFIYTCPNIKYIYIYISTRMQDSYTKSIRLFLFINIYKNMQMYSK